MAHGKDVAYVIAARCVYTARSASTLARAAVMRDAPLYDTRCYAMTPGAGAPALMLLPIALPGLRLRYRRL